MTKQEILSAIKECARKLGRAPTSIEFASMTCMTRYAVIAQFGRFNRALDMCRLKPSRERPKVKLAELFRDWATVVRRLKKIPTVAQYRKLGGHSDTSLRQRFHSWHEIGQGFRNYADQNGWTQEWQDVLQVIAAQGTVAGRGPRHKERKRRLLPDRPVYGRVMHRCQLAHAPVNEQGVLFLFGVMAERLGFVVMHVQQAFPDCEAMRQIGQDHCQRVWIEIEHESRNFLKHRHSIKGCDLIICWKHNWPECPLEVVELSRYLPEMPGLPKVPAVVKKVRK